MRTVAKTFEKSRCSTQWKILIPDVGWRVVSRSEYSCPHWVPPGADDPYGGRGLRGHVSIKGKRVWIQWLPDKPVQTGVETEGRLRFGR